MLKTCIKTQDIYYCIVLVKFQCPQISISLTQTKLRSWCLVPNLSAKLLCSQNAGKLWSPESLSRLGGPAFIVTFLICWFGNLHILNKNWGMWLNFAKKKQTSKKTIHVSWNGLDSVYKARVTQRGCAILVIPLHPLHAKFQITPS